MEGKGEKSLRKEFKILCLGFKRKVKQEKVYGEKIRCIVFERIFLCVSRVFRERKRDKELMYGRYG